MVNIDEKSQNSNKRNCVSIICTIMSEWYQYTMLTMSKFGNVLNYLDSDQTLIESLKQLFGDNAQNISILLSFIVASLNFQITIDKQNISTVNQFSFNQHIVSSVVNIVELILDNDLWCENNEQLVDSICNLLVLSDMVTPQQRVNLIQLTAKTSKAKNLQSSLIQSSQVHPKNVKFDTNSAAIDPEFYAYDNQNMDVYMKELMQQLLTSYQHLDDTSLNHNAQKIENRKATLMTMLCDNDILRNQIQFDTLFDASQTILRLKSFGYREIQPKINSNRTDVSKTETMTISLTMTTEDHQPNKIEFFKFAKFIILRTIEKFSLLINS